MHEPLDRVIRLTRGIRHKCKKSLKYQEIKAGTLELTVEEAQFRLLFDEGKCPAMQNIGN